MIILFPFLFLWLFLVFVVLICLSITTCSCSLGVGSCCIRDRYNASGRLVLFIPDIYIIYFCNINFILYFQLVLDCYLNTDLPCFIRNILNNTFLWLETLKNDTLLHKEKTNLIVSWSFYRTDITLCFSSSFSVNNFVVRTRCGISVFV